MWTQSLYPPKHPKSLHLYLSPKSRVKCYKTKVSSFQFNSNSQITERKTGVAVVVMGNQRFRLSDIIPYAWFHKLKHMTKPRKNHTNNINNTPHSHTKKVSKFQRNSATKSQSPKSSQQCHQNQRQSYYFSRELTPTTPTPNPTPGHRFCNSPANPKVSDTNFPDPPKSPKPKPKPKKRMTKKPSPALKPVTSSVSAGCGCRTTVESVWSKTDSQPELWFSSSFDTSPDPEFRCDGVLATETFDALLSMSGSSEKDIVIDVDKASLTVKLSDMKLSDTPENGLDLFSELELELAPIITKPAKFSEMVKDVKKKKDTKEAKTRFRRSSAKNPEEQRTNNCSVKSPGLRLRMNSPRIANRKINQGRRSVSSNSSSRRSSLSDGGAFAIVKSSFDPQRDFRESMVEMILENNIKASKDLEDLLACYLSLNADEYHELIIKVFKQIWFDLTDTRPSK